ncbi:MAG: hypothetical protein HFI71_00530 [Lachnospiraceae bacterium]|nr:hypothetical protein [Lachnospiraceae bacterium]
MLNVERIRLMTKMASYEKGEGKESMPIKQYYRRDYVSFGMLKTFFTSTIAFGILCICWMLYELENITEILSGRDLTAFGISILIKYIIFVVVYQAIAFAVYYRRYTKATASLKEYYSILKKVQKLQEKEERTQPLEERK